MKKNPWCSLYAFPNGTKCHAGIEGGMEAAFVTSLAGESFDYAETDWENAFKQICKCEGVSEERCADVMGNGWNLVEAIEEIGGKIGYCEDCPHKGSCYKYGELEDED